MRGRPFGDQKDPFRSERLSKSNFPRPIGAKSRHSDSAENITGAGYPIKAAARDAPPLTRRRRIGGFTIAKTKATRQFAVCIVRCQGVLSTRYPLTAPPIRLRFAM